MAEAEGACLPAMPYRHASSPPAKVKRVAEKTGPTPPTQPRMAVPHWTSTGYEASGTARLRRKLVLCGGHALLVWHRHACVGFLVGQGFFPAAGFPAGVFGDEKSSRRAKKRRFSSTGILACVGFFSNLFSL